MKRNTLGLSIAAMLGTREEVYQPSSLCSLDDLPKVMYAGGDDTPNAPGITIRNWAVAAQVVAAATATYIVGSALALPQGAKLQVGTRLRWKFTMTKTAAGTATSTISIVFGLLGTTADTARVSFTKPAGTAVVDEGTVTIEATVRSVSETGVVVGNFTLVHNLAATGHAQIPVVDVSTVSAGFDNSSDEGLIAGLVITTGAADAITIEQVQAELVGAN